MLVSGEDPNYILRRLTRFANEDIGLSEPNAISMAISTWQAFERLGSPEGDLSIAQLVIYLSTCPKSNSTYKAWNNVKSFVKEHPYASPPMSILNAPTKLMKDIGYGKGYIYDHNSADAFSGQNCFPENVNRETFYRPVERGYEREIKKRDSQDSQREIAPLTKAHDAIELITDGLEIEAVLAVLLLFVAVLSIVAVPWSYYDFGGFESACCHAYN